LTSWLFRLYTELMTMPPCEHCGQPWAHGSEGASVRRNRGRVVALAAIGGVVQALIIVLVAFIVLGFSSRPSTVEVIQNPLPPGPLRPQLQACTLFTQWAARADASTTLLNRAVADASSPRVPWPWRARLRADLSGLQAEVRQGAFVHSRPMTDSYALAVQADCAPVLADWHHIWHQRRISRLRHGPATRPARSASARPPHSTPGA
jgi:hypothetical protein